MSKQMGAHFSHKKNSSTMNIEMAQTGNSCGPDKPSFRAWEFKPMTFSAYKRLEAKPWVTDSNFTF